MPGGYKGDHLDGFMSPCIRWALQDFAERLPRERAFYMLMEHYFPPDLQCKVCVCVYVWVWCP